MPVVGMKRLTIPVSAASHMVRRRRISWQGNFLRLILSNAVSAK